MNRIDYFPVYIGVWASLVCAVLATYQIDPFGVRFTGALIFWGIVYGIGLLAGWAHNRRSSKVIANISNVLLILAVLITVFAFSSAGLESAIVMFLISVQAARNLTLVTRRDFYFAVVISVMLVIYGIGITRHSYYFFYLAAYVFAILFTFMAAHVDERLSLARGGDHGVLTRQLSVPVSLLGSAAAIVTLAAVIYLFLPQPPSPELEVFPAQGGSRYANKDWERQARLPPARVKPGKIGLPSDGSESGQGQGQSQGQSQGQGQGQGNTGESGSSNGEQGQDGLEGGTGTEKGPMYQGFNAEFDVTRPWSGGGRGGGSGTGQSSEGKSPDNDIVIRLLSNRPLYARGRVFDNFDGRYWRDSNAPRHKLWSTDQQFDLVNDGSSATVGQIYQIEQPLPSVIFAAHRPVSVLFPSRVIETGEDQTLRAPASLSPDTIYSVKSVIHLVGSDERPGSGETSLYDPDDRYRQVPGSLSEQARALAVQVTSAGSNDLTRATALERHLRENYSYTFDTVGKVPVDDLVDHFLFVRKEGHCEIFATTMAMMLRSVNIPARLATGFSTTNHNPLTGYYEIRRFDGHAWVEAYIAGHGWVSFEPTPGFTIPTPKTSSTPIAALIEHLKSKIMADHLQSRVDWSTHLSEFLVNLWETLKRWLSALGEALFEFVRAVGRWLWSNIILLLVGSVAAVFVIKAWRRMHGVFILRLWLERWRLARLRGGDARRYIIGCYAGAERLCAHIGLPRLDSWTHREYEMNLAGRVGWLQQPVSILTELFGLARYSAMTLRADHAQLAGQAFTQISKSLREVAGVLQMHRT